MLAGAPALIPGEVNLIGVLQLRRDRLGRFCACSTLALVALTLVSGKSAHAGKIPWTGSGAYEVCLEEGANAWLAHTAELIVANDESARATGDADVAALVIGLMKTCSGKAQPADPANDAAFTKYMARWRDHVYELARAIRATGGAD